MSKQPKEPASPACLAHEADDAYMGFASQAEIAALLNELLEAERAGAAVALRSAEAAEASGSPYGKLLRDIQHDEARWCAMLLKQLQALDEPASPRIGAFLEKAMAIEGLSERIAFLNRGQGWVVRKLREMLPKVRDDGLHRALDSMLQAHEANIQKANKTLESGA
jgi:hypothetical protein